MSTDQIAIGLIFTIAMVGLGLYFNFRDRYVDLQTHPERKYNGSLELATHGDIWPEGAHNPWVEWRGERVEGCLSYSFGEEERVCIDRSFVTRLVGVSHLNDDGTSRIEAIRRTGHGERLAVRWEENYPHGEGFGKIILRQNGEQLGWLGKDVAKKIHPEFVDPGHTWMAVFQYASRRPDTAETVGAVILVVRRTPAGGEWFWDRNRNTVLAVECKTCGAKEAVRCKTLKDGGPSSPHVARVRAFQAVMSQRNARP